MPDLSSRTRDDLGRLVREARIQPADKRCVKCEATKTLHAFSTDRRKRDGRKSWCKECLAAKERARHAANPERFRAYDAARKESRNARLRARRIADPMWAARERENRSSYYQVQRAGLTADFLLERDGAVCHICGLTVARRDAEADHVIPLSRGGSHDASNVKLSHSRCNRRKGDKLLSELSFAV